jgi:NAD(P)-dependent dehydrogenase (short-subunit alcohol dehydrogenase family)
MPVAFEARVRLWSGRSRLDVSVAAEIEADARLIEEELGERGLAALVNNAGIVTAGPPEFLPAVDLREELEVNAVGPIAVTQGLLPCCARPAAG